MAVEFVHRFFRGTTPFTLLLLHGTGGDEDDLVPVGRAVAPGTSILSPRGKVSEQGAYRFFARRAEGVFDEDEVRSRIAELAEWVRAATKQYEIDPGKLFALGYSNGANAAGALMLLQPGTITGAVLLRSMAVVQPETLPDLQASRVLVAGGQRDRLIPPAESEKLARLLMEAGATVDFALQDAEHGLTPADFSMAKRWFGEKLIDRQDGV